MAAKEQHVRTADVQVGDDSAVQVDEETGDAAGLAGVVGAALGAIAAGPVGAALGAAGGMALGAGTELALHAREHLHHEHTWENDMCTRCGASKRDAAAVSPSRP